MNNNNDKLKTACCFGALVFACILFYSCNNRVKEKKYLDADEQYINDSLSTSHTISGDSIMLYNNNNSTNEDEKSEVSNKKGTKTTTNYYDSNKADAVFQEGKDNGFEQGYYDGANQKGYQFYFDDSSDYSGKYNEIYSQGYLQGYDVGYNQATGIDN